MVKNKFFALNKFDSHCTLSMNLKTFLFFLFLFTFSNIAFGQKKKSKFRGKQSSQELLEEARAIYEKNPKGAINILDRIINQKSKKRETKLESGAYTLLGDIYLDINQTDLALARYQRALSLIQKTKYISEKATLYYQIGKLHLERADAESANKSFTYCIKMNGGKKTTQLCEEGLADVESLRGNTNESISQLDKVQSQYAVSDSLDNARLNAKKSQVYAQQNDYGNAYESLKNSVDNLPKDKKVKKEDYKEIEKAKKDILDLNSVTNAEKIDLTTNTLPKADRIEPLPEIAVRENLQVASLYEKENNLIEAERFIEISKAAIDVNTPATSAADVYKKSAEINQKKGAIDAALVDLEKYIEAKERAIQDLENELKQQVDIVKGQQQIDLVEKDFVLEEKEEELLRSQVGTQKWIIGLLSLLLGASFIFFYFLNKNVKAKRKANQLLLLKSLRTQMNPHFIFNALNSVNNFIAKNDEKAANKFLSEFSRLMRKVLDHSQKDLISFEEEMELNELYLKLEHFRFRDKFEYQFEKNIDLNTYDLEIPPMLIQPFIENAVWHGLRYKEGKGNLKVSIDEKENHLLITIMDNGIGRTRSKELKTTNQKKYKSTGLDNVSRRVALINEVYEKNYEIHVEDASDLKEDTGTLVTIKIPT